MKKTLLVLSVLTWIGAQELATDDPILKAIYKLGLDSSHLEINAHELLDNIGPRLVGTPQMKKANDWAVKKLQSYNINGRNEQFGEWDGWERGVTHIDMLEPRIRTLEGTVLAWSPGTGKDGVKGTTIILPDLADSLAYVNWLPSVKGKMVLISMPQPTGRTDDNWEKFSIKENFDKMKEDRKKQGEAWQNRMKKSGFTRKSITKILEKAGALAIVSSNWSNGWGVNKIFGTNTIKIPTIDLSLEDYSLLFRMTEKNDKPVIRIYSDSKLTGKKVPSFNTIGEIKGVEKPNEYIILSCHFDSWDAGSGATDNGTGSLTMMEAMRILKKVYPNPKRTIIVGFWNSEEQGLNGSRAFAKNHPEIVNGLQALFNQDNGTGRIVNISAAGLLNAGESLVKWITRAPREVTKNIETYTFPGSPAGGGSDNASFIAYGAPSFGLGSNSWDYFNYTWHTNRDTYDKIVFEELRNNVILVATLAYLASEDEEFVNRDKRLMPLNKDGKLTEWPKVVDPDISGDKFFDREIKKN